MPSNIQILVTFETNITRKYVRIIIMANFKRVLNIKLVIKTTVKKNTLMSRAQILLFHTKYRTLLS